MIKNGKKSGINVSDELNRTIGWLNVFTFLVFVLIVWGALVRITGSGLSIPDWPVINGSLLPPLTANAWDDVIQDYHIEAERVDNPQLAPDVTVRKFKTMFWIEYMHRLLAAVAGIMYLVIFINAFKSKAVREKIQSNLTILFFLLIMQAVMGGIVVKSALTDMMVAIHLTIAFIFFAGLIWTSLSLSRTESQEGESRSLGFTPLTLSLLLLILYACQVWFGGLVAGGGVGRIINTWPLIFGSIVPRGDLLMNPSFNNILQNFFSNQVLIQFIHRWLGFLVFIAFIALWVRTLKEQLLPRTRFALRAMGGMIALQILLGIFNVLFSTPTAISLTHSANSAATFGMLIIVIHDMRYSFRNIEIE